MILVTGGAGYIGSHVTRELLDRGYSVIVVDNLSTGHLQAVDPRATFIFGDIGDSSLFEFIFNSYHVEAIMHFAANCLVNESVSNPILYYQNNVGKSIQLLEKVSKYKIKNFIFSSTCATYGIPRKLPITEETANNPINPYGKTKLMVEHLLRDLSASNGLSFIALRYFNVAGAHHSAQIGEDHTPETHLIPNIIKHLQGKTDFIEVYGDKHDTRDGTCIRDYIHVVDLSKAHIFALEHLLKRPNEIIAQVYNVGTETGYSVLEIINSCEEIIGKTAILKIQPCRIGDPPKLVASSRMIQRELGWSAQNSLRDIIQSAWKWHEKYPNGYL